MNGDRTLAMAWPREVSPDQLADAATALFTVGDTPLVLQLVGSAGRVEHRLVVREDRTPAVTTRLRLAIPGLGLEGLSDKSEGHTPPFDMAVRIGVSTSRRALRTDQPGAITALLSAVAAAAHGERLLLEWSLLRPLPPQVVPNRLPDPGPESWLRAAALASIRGVGPADAETRRALLDKRGVYGWRAIGRIAVAAAGKSRQRQLIGGVVRALRAFNAPGAHITVKAVRPSSLKRLPRRGASSVNRVELMALSGWPIGPTAGLPINRLGSRRLPPPRSMPVAKHLRVMGMSTWPGQEQRPIGVAVEDSLRHAHIVGPTGTGKSTLLLRLALQDIEAGRSVVVIEPRGDLIADLLARIPEQRREDVVVIDPSAAGEYAVGLNPLGQGDLGADQLLDTIRGLFLSSWGPRTADILGAALLTLSRVPGMSLAAVPLLLSDRRFRRSIVGRVNDPLGLTPFWASYEAWSDAERIAATAPVLNKLRPFLTRPALRRIVGQAAPAFAMREVFTKRRVVLVNLAKGQVGADSANLLGALVMLQLWQAALGRAAVAPERRHPVFVYLDEFQDYLSLPLALGDALVQARGLGVGFTLAHQHLGQLDRSMVEAVLANARSRVTFQLAEADARTLAGKSPLLGTEDFQGLSAFHFYAHLLVGNQVQPWCSGRALPAPDATTDASKVRREALRRYGRAVAEIDAEQLAMQGVAVNDPTGSAPSPDDNDLAPRRRKRGAA